MSDASFALGFAALSVTLLLLCVAFIYLLPYVSRTRRNEGFCGKLTLPYARTARLDETPDPERLTICIHRDGAMCISGNTLTDEQVRDALIVEARLTRTVEGISDRILLIAADEGAPLKSIKKIVDLCNSRDIRIWRLSFATRPTEEPGAVWR